jgi:hypothetical protein
MRSYVCANIFAPNLQFCKITHIFWESYKTHKFAGNITRVFASSVKVGVDTVRHKGLARCSHCPLDQIHSEMFVTSFHNFAYVKMMFPALRLTHWRARLINVSETSVSWWQTLLWRHVNTFVQPESVAGNSVTVMHFNVRNIKFLLHEKKWEQIAYSLRLRRA